MKNLFKIGVFVVLLLNSLMLHANDDGFSFKVKRVDKKSVSFFIEGGQTVALSLYDDTYEVLYQQTIQALGSSTKIYNLDAFPDGNYVFRLVTEQRSAEYKVLIADGKAVVAEPVVVESFKPVFSKDNEFVTLKLDNAPADQIEVQVFDKYNDLLYSKIFDVKSKFIKKFNVAQVYAQELTFTVKCKDQEFKEVVSMY